MSHLSAKLTPLHQLLKKGVRQQWKENIKSFAEAKRALQDDTLLVHYDSTHSSVCVPLWPGSCSIALMLKSLVLEELHDTHQGASKMKSLTKSYIWWPKI